MQSFNQKEFSEYLKRITKFQDDLLKNGVEIPGYTAGDRSYWLFPILAPDPVALHKMLVLRGVDAYLGATQLKVIEAPTGSKFGDMSSTKEFFDKVVIKLRTIF